MDKVLYLIAAMVVIGSTLAAWLTPTALAAQYKRWSKAIGFVLYAGLLWVVTDDATTLKSISGIVEDPTYPQDQALHMVRLLATDAMTSGRAAIPALLALGLSLAYLELLGRSRTGTPDAPAT